MSTRNITKHHHETSMFVCGTVAIRYNVCEHVLVTVHIGGSWFWLPLPPKCHSSHSSLTDEKLEAKWGFFFFFFWRRRRDSLHQSVIISLPAVSFSLHIPSALLSLHQGQNAYTTMKTQGEKKGLWGEELQGEFGERWDDEEEEEGRKKVSVGVEVTRWSFNDPCGENRPLLQQILRR